MANTPISSLTNGGITLPSDDTLVNRAGTNFRTQCPVSTAGVATTFSKTNAALANITGLSLNVTGSAFYALDACLFTTSVSAAGVQAAIGGTATATTIGYYADITDSGLQVAPGTVRAAALAAKVGDATAVTVANINIRGTIAVNAAGTLTVQFAQNVSAASTPSTVIAGSYFKLTQIS